MNGKCEENEQFEVTPHPAFSHLLPEGEGKEANNFVSLKRSNLQVKSMTQNPRPLADCRVSKALKNPRPFWERGDHASGG